MRFTAASAALGLLIGACRTEPDQPASQPIAEAPLQFPSDPAGRAIVAHLGVMFATGADAEARYASSLDSLRARPTETVRLLAQAYDRAPVAAYPPRWALVRTLADLQIDGAVEPLSRIARTPVPPPDTGRHALRGAFQQEAIIRMTAIEGLGHLAGTNQLATATLVELTRSPVASVSEEAARALLGRAESLRDTVMARQLRDIVPSHLRHLLPLVRDPVPPANANPELRPRSRQSGTAPRVSG